MDKREWRCKKACSVLCCDGRRLEESQSLLYTICPKAWKMERTSIKHLSLRRLWFYLKQDMLCSSTILSYHKGAIDLPPYTASWMDGTPLQELKHLLSMFPRYALHLFLLFPFQHLLSHPFHPTITLRPQIPPPSWPAHTTSSTPAPHDPST